MKLLALSDLHADEELLDRLRAISSRSQYDAVLYCGDITNRGPVSYAEEAVKIFPNVYAVHGNMDTPEVVQALSSLGVLIHGKKVRLGEWNLVGLGGSNPTPFHTPSELSEQEIESTLARAGVNEFSILLSHPPPFGVFDSVGPTHVGSQAVRKIVERKKPIMVICGHIHEYEGKEILGETLIVKLAPAEKMRAAEIEISDAIDVKFISL
ncbi:TPA: metallophosphoesterase [Candidatus Micrarchaeota archaeon]|nr:metallophosphoesterase [Candidatus Micrarchaeota archaeon]HIH30141.1 metallophosphoesterase [Candidatus Micrarchaeota archaeon]